MSVAGLRATASRAGIDLQRVVDVAAGAVKVDQQVHVLLQRGRRERRPPDPWTTGKRMLKLQQRLAIEIGKSPDASLLHPAHEFAQMQEVAGRRSRVLSEAGAQ